MYICLVFTLQLRDDFIETPALPPDAVAWVVSDFQRESLEPSAVYQAATTVVPPLHPRQPSDTPTDNISFRADKRPNKNIFSGMLTKPLKPTTAVPITVHNQTAETKNATITVGNNALGISTAPSYTFYASRKILERSGFVLHTSRDVLEFLQTWLGVAYPLVKLGELKIMCIYITDIKNKMQLRYTFPTIYLFKKPNSLSILLLRLRRFTVPRPRNDQLTWSDHTADWIFARTRSNHNSPIPYVGDQNFRGHRQTVSGRNNFAQILETFLAVGRPD